MQNPSSGEPAGAAANGVQPATGDGGHPPERRLRLPLAIGFAALAFWVYAPSFPGGPISDDVAYLLNPWVTRMNADDLIQAWNPTSQITIFHNNYAPIRPMLHALEWRLFPENSAAYHGVNVAVHTAVAFLLFLLLARSGLPPLAAALGGAWFLLHPANVEPVAWMSQLWSPAALAFGLGALLCQRRRPLASALLFAAALLTKPLAICLLPAAMLREWAWRSGRGGARRWAALAG